MQTKTTLLTEAQLPAGPTHSLGPLASLCLSMLAIMLSCGGLFLMGIAAAYAQPAPSKGAAPRDTSERSAELAKSLKLTASQATTVEAIIAAERDAHQKLRDEMRVKRDAIDTNTNAKLAKLLNAEQMGRYREWKEANRPPRPDGPPPGGMPPRERLK